MRRRLQQQAYCIAVGKRRAERRHSGPLAFRNSVKRYGRRADSGRYVFVE